MFTRLFHELQHRRVFRAVAGYAVVAWIAVEAADVAFPALGVPESFLTALIITVLAGFPLVAILAWIFDISLEGISIGSAPPASDIGLSRLSQVSSWLLVLVLGVAVAYLSMRLMSPPQFGSTLSRGKSVAVLPFKNIAAGNQTATLYFSDGVAEEILSGLASVNGLRVAARTSSFVYRDEVDVRKIGEVLNVSTVLEGSVRMDPESDRIRIAVRLIETDEGSQLWSDTFDYELEDIFTIQDEIALSIVRALKMEFSAHDTQLIQPGTASIGAYRAYLEGRYRLQHGTVAAIDEAIELFDRSITLDPDYAQGYAGLADAWIGKRRIGNLSLQAATQLSHDAISNALRLNSTLAEAQTSLGLCILGAGQQRGAALQFAKAIELDPENSNAHLQRANLLRDQGYLADASRAYTQAQALDPLNVRIVVGQSILMALQGRYERALDQLDHLLADGPDRLLITLTISEISALAGNSNRSLQLALQAQALAADNPIVLTRLVDAHIQLGRLDDAEIVLKRAITIAPENESVIQVSQRFLLVAGRHAELNELTSRRAQLVIGNPGLNGSKLRLERLVWGALGRFAAGDSSGASEWLEEALPSTLKLDPIPQSIHYLALLAWSRAVEDNGTATVNDAVKRGRAIATSVKSQGWGTGEFNYALATLAAANGEFAVALRHLSEAIDRGWRGVSLANHDPALALLHESPEYLALINDVDES